MGLLSKLKEVFSGKPIETFKEFDKDLNNLYKKLDCSIIALVGTASKIKGLPLIYSAAIENEVRKNSAKLVEFLDPLNKFSEGKKIQDFLIDYEDEFLFFKPILDNICIFAIFKQKNDLIIIQNWINNKILTIKNLFQK